MVFNTLEKPPESASQEQLKIIEFQDINGQAHHVRHPYILTEAHGIFREDDRVEVGLSQKTESMVFADYLARIGVSYNWFYRACKENPDSSVQDILHDLHQQSIDQRTQTAIRQHREYGQEKATGDNLQRETTKNHSPLFARVINDLGVDGLSAKESLPRQDYLDGIDEIVEFDPEEFKSQGERHGQKISIGIQRSFNDKRGEIVRDPVRFFPEEPESGPVFRVFVKETISDYIDENTGISFMQKLLDKRNEKARQLGQEPYQYARSARNEGFPPVAQVLPGGEKEQISRALDILTEIKRQFGDFLSSERFRSLSPAVQKDLEDKWQSLDLDKYILSVEGLSSAA